MHGTVSFLTAAGDMRHVAVMIYVGSVVDDDGDQVNDEELTNLGGRCRVDRSRRLRRKRCRRA